MTHIATVKMWRKNYGFAEADDGSIVHITREEIGGMALQPGLTVTCDLVPVEGHAGRVKGTNVTGEAIVPADTEFTVEEKKANREEWDAFKKEKIAVDGAPPPRKERAEKKKPSAAKGGKNGGKGAKAAKAAKGVPARSAGAPRSNPRVEERRIDPADGNSYTRNDFIAQYGGLTQWNAAAPRQQVRAPAGRGGAMRDETRIDPADGRAYRKADFMACYGGYQEWDRANPYNANRGRGRGGRR